MNEIPQWVRVLDFIGKAAVFAGFGIAFGGFGYIIASEIGWWLSPTGLETTTGTLTGMAVGAVGFLVAGLIGGYVSMKIIAAIGRAIAYAIWGQPSAQPSTSTDPAPATEQTPEQAPQPSPQPAMQAQSASTERDAAHVSTPTSALAVAAPEAVDPVERDYGPLICKATIDMKRVIHVRERAYLLYRAGWTEKLTHALPRERAIIDDVNEGLIRRITLTDSQTGEVFLGPVQLLNGAANKIVHGYS